MSGKESRSNRILEGLIKRKIPYNCNMFYEKVRGLLKVSNFFYLSDGCHLQYSKRLLCPGLVLLKLSWGKGISYKKASHEFKNYLMFGYNCQLGF